MNLQFLIADYNAIATLPAVQLLIPGNALLLTNALSVVTNAYNNFIATFRNNQDGGFSINPSTPTSVVATSIALNALNEINRVVRVDANITASARAYVLRFRNGLGGFNNTGSNMNLNTSNAFIILNLVRSGAFVATEFNSEIVALRAVADASIRNGTQDVYFLTLLGQTLYALNRPLEGVVYGDAVAALINAQGSWNATEPAFSSTFGAALNVEVAASALTLLRNNVKWAAVATRAQNYLLVSTSYEAANQGVIQSARLIDAALALPANFRNLNGRGSIQVFVNGVALGNATEFVSTQSSIDFRITQADLAAANLTSLFNQSSRINVTFSVASFVANTGATTDLLLPAVLTHTFAEINSTNTSPRVIIRDAVLQRAQFILGTGRPNLVVTLNNTANVTGRIRLSIRHSATLVPVTSTLAALRSAGQIVSWDSSVNG